MFGQIMFIGASPFIAKIERAPDWQSESIGASNRCDCSQIHPSGSTATGGRSVEGEVDTCFTLDA